MFPSTSKSHTHTHTHTLNAESIDVAMRNGMFYFISKQALCEMLTHGLCHLKNSSLLSPSSYFIHLKYIDFQQNY